MPEKMMGEMGTPDLQPVEGRDVQDRISMPQPMNGMSFTAVKSPQRGKETNTGLDGYSSDQASYTGPEEGFFKKNGSDSTQ